MSIENQKRLLTCIEAGLPIPGDVAAWYMAAWREHVETNKPLCLCLGLRGAGIRSAKKRELLRHRDVLLKFAASSCTQYPGESLWSKCETLADMIRRWPRSKSENPLLPHLFNLPIELPQSAVGIHDRIKPTRRTPPLFTEYAGRGK